MGGILMGLMDRDYMNRTPEERVNETVEDRKHQERQKEMYALFAKGENMTSKDRKRLEQIYEENRRYMTQKQTPTQNFSSSKSSSSIKEKSKSLPILIFITVLLLIVLAFTLFPELGNLKLWN